MKKQIALMLSAALAMTACSKSSADAWNPPYDGNGVEITFAEGSPSRAFFDDTATAEEWEKTLTSLKILVYDKDGNFVVSRSLSDDELEARKTFISLPKRLSGTSCTFAAVANSTAPDSRTLAGLDAALEKEPSSYNGTFATVASSSARSSGFAMSGKAVKTVESEGVKTSVSITLARLTAKIAVRTAIADAFGEKYPGVLSITGIELVNGSSQALVMPSATENEGAHTFSFTQVPGQSGQQLQSLFYAYPCGARESADRVTLLLKGKYDPDGSTSTTSDQIDVRYEVRIGDSAGAVARNGYYRVDLTIVGLEGEKCEAEITVSDWETPVTQTVSLGF